jgi:hypothetical protein
LTYLQTGYDRKPLTTNIPFLQATKATSAFTVVSP